MIILNEKEYAEQCISNGFVGKKPYNTLFIIAKYYYSIGYKGSAINKELNTFMENNYPRYNSDRNSWSDTIENIVKRAKKFKLYEDDGVWVTQRELNKIGELKLKSEQKLMFTILCLAKLANLRNEKNNGWVNNDRKEIFTLARVNCSVAERNSKIGYLSKAGYLDLAKKNGNLSVRVAFIDDNSKKVLHVEDFRELGYEYLKYIGENFVRCRECGILIRNNKNKTRKYCSNCSGYRKQEMKKVICVDCGKEFSINSKNNQSCRCNECKLVYRKKYKADFERNKRNEYSVKE